MSFDSSVGWGLPQRFLLSARVFQSVTTSEQLFGLFMMPSEQKNFLCGMGIPPMKSGFLMSKKVFYKGEALVLSPKHTFGSQFLQLPYELTKSAAPCHRHSRRRLAGIQCEPHRHNREGFFSLVDD